MNQSLNEDKLKVQDTLPNNFRVRLMIAACIPILVLSLQLPYNLYWSSRTKNWSPAQAELRGWEVRTNYTKPRFQHDIHPIYSFSVDSKEYEGRLYCYGTKSYLHGVITRPEANMIIGTLQNGVMYKPGFKSEIKYDPNNPNRSVYDQDSCSFDRNWYYALFGVLFSGLLFILGTRLQKFYSKKN